MEATLTREYFVKQGKLGGLSGWKDPKQRARRLRQLARARKKAHPKKVA